MKRFLPFPHLTFFWLIGTAATAQFTPDSRFIGGGFSITTPVAPKLANTINITLQPELGRFRSENVATGFTTVLGYKYSKISDTETNNSVSVGVGPFVQRFLPIIDKFGFVLTARSSFALTSTTTKKTGSTPITNSSLGVGLGLSGSPGMFYSISERWLLLLDLGAYQALSISYANQGTTASDVKTSGFSYGIGQTFSLSGSAIRVRYFL